ncbi:hypothetical protein Q3C01_43355 [Bradyrhizobium sp. UFLA05-109]
MNIKAVMARIIEAELLARGVHSLAPSDCEQIVEWMVEQIGELEPKLARDKNDEP